MQLPPRLSIWLKQHGQAAIHASDLPGGTTLPDSTLWEMARRDGWILVSKDSDFLDMMLVNGSPPRLVYIALGNCSNARLIAHLESQWDRITSALDAGASTVAVYASHIAIYD